MEKYLMIIGLVLAGLVGWFIGKLLSHNQYNRRINTLEIDNQKLKQANIFEENQKKEIQNQLKDDRLAYEEKEKSYQKEKDQWIEKSNQKEQELNIKLTKSQDTVERLEEKLVTQQKEYKVLQEKFTKDFELLANKILEEKSSKFTEQNKLNLKAVLDPLHEKIQHFEKKVDEVNKENIMRNSQLREQIFNLKALNEQMSKEALNLTKALKGDNKAQGNWGELVLERVLEKSGLEKGREYEVQQSFNTEEGKRVIPDVIVLLPDNKRMIIDSKVSLTAYERYINEEDETEKAQFLKTHIQSLNRHVEELSAKKYEDLYPNNSPDFVLLFVPIEPAFAIALSQDSQMYNKAFEKNIVIVTPTTLLATLRTIDTLWNNEKQQRNAIEIARQAGALYDKFEGLIGDLLKMGKKIEGVKEDYKATMNKLTDGRGNLVTSVEKLKKLGAKAKKSLPQSLLSRANEDNAID